MSQGVTALVAKSELNAACLYNLRPENRLPVVDYLTHALGLSGNEVAAKLRIARQTVVRDLREIRRLRGKLELDFLPAKELASGLIADAETCYFRALKQGDPVGAFAIKLKLSQELKKLGLVQDADDTGAPTTLAGVRRQLSERLKTLAIKSLPAGDAKDGAVNGSGTNGAAAHPPGDS